MDIYTFRYKDVDIDILYKNKAVAFTFEIDGKKYGNKVAVPSRKAQDIINASFLLFTNAAESIEAIKNENK